MNNLEVKELRVNEVRAPKARRNDDLKLLVEWSSPWEEFVTAIRPALSKSPAPLDAEAQSGLFPYRGMLLALAVESLLFLLAIFLPAKLASMRPFQAAPPPKYDVIYFSGDELPQTEDNGGAQSGRSGRSGGREGHHSTQVIRVARGPSVREKVVDAPKLNLPHSDSAVANLLAYKSVPGPPPTEGLQSSSRVAAMPAAAVPPPAEVRAQQLRNNPSLEANVVAPSPNALERDVVTRHVQGSQVSVVVPPPVSAPNEITNLHSRLTLPASSIIPPAPAEREARTRRGTEDFQKQMVVPPSAETGPAVSERPPVNGLGNAPVVAPAAQLNHASRTNAKAGGLGGSSVVPPPAQVSGASGRRDNTLANGTAVVPPPAQVNGASGRQGSKELSTSIVPPSAQVNGTSTRREANGFSGGASIVPPPAQVAGTSARQGSPGLSSSVVAPAPSASGTSGSGSGSGRRGPADAMASTVAPPSNAASTGIVLSNKPGSKVGSPTSVPGSMALSPAGGAQPGLGGTGGGNGTGHGNGPGSSTSGEGSGAKTAGEGHGSNELAKNGISPFPGSGGAGKGTAGPPTMPGVSVSGGSSNNIMKLPSFGSDGKPLNDPAHSPALKDAEGPGITVVATSHSGGAFNFYGALKGDKVYTIYIDTALGTAVMQFADPKSATQNYSEDLTAPQALRADIPSDLKASRLIIACTLDHSGLVKNARVMDAKSADLSSKIMAALPGWKFRPAMRANEPIDVNVILGFDIDTN